MLDGKWMVHLDPLATSNQEQTLLVEGNNRLELSGVLVGEVWLCSGQSNMADSFNSSKNRFIEPEYFEKGLTRMRVSTRHGWTGIDRKDTANDLPRRILLWRKAVPRT